MKYGCGYEERLRIVRIRGLASLFIFTLLSGFLYIAFKVQEHGLLCAVIVFLMFCNIIVIMRYGVEYRMIRFTDKSISRQWSEFSLFTRLFVALAACLVGAFFLLMMVGAVGEAYREGGFEGGLSGLIPIFLVAGLALWVVYAIASIGRSAKDRTGDRGH